MNKYKNVSTEPESLVVDFVKVWNYKIYGIVSL